MIYRNLFINLVVRIFFIAVTCFILALTYFALNDWVIMFNILLLLILQVVLLIRYMNRLNLDLFNFFSAIRNDDSSIVYKRMAPSKSLVKLYECFDDINTRIRNLKIETAGQNLYLQNLVDHVAIGLISVDNEGNVELINTAARKLFDIPSIKNISRLKKIDAPLPDKLLKMNPGSPLLLNLKINHELVKIAVKATLLRIEKKEIRLLSFQNIKAELEENELDSYQKLIRILTHEIMNSTGPILSSISSIKEFLTEKDTGNTRKIGQLNQQLLDDSVKGLNIIEERSSGLADFVEKFRSLTLLPKPVFKNIPVSNLLIDIELLMKAECKRNNIRFTVETIPKDLSITADKKLIEQVIINLITNSIQAFSQQPEKEIKIRAFRNSEKKVIIQLIDNGSGIPDLEMEHIFVPFYTTKEKGSGIGLSLSRQIIRLHHGMITLKSEPGKKTVATLEF
ncbi:MAG TPA: ATP-binding protein [Bacteroidales bacterium]|nr:ATP-binding protein [Bacteroidales bacterium]